MDKHSLDWHLDVLHKYGFNAIRYPLSIPTIMNTSAIPQRLCKTEPILCKKHPMDFLETVIDRAAKLGIMVMPSFNNFGYYSNEKMWYTDQYSEADALNTLDRLFSLFKRKWNVMAFDIMNEPRGKANWGSGDVETDWRMAAIRFLKYLYKKHPDYQGLYFVQGICCFGKWFRTDLSQFSANTGISNIDNRIVYSAHNYRPGRLDEGKPMRSDEEFISQWDAMYGQVEKETGHAQVFGEWGDSLDNPKGRHWMELFAKWMTRNCQKDFFAWCFQGGKGDMAVIRTDDETTVNVEKMKLLQAIQTHATTIKKTKQGYLISDVGQAC